MSEPVTPAEVENPPAESAGDQDHENPDNFRGEEAEAPRNPTVEEYTTANEGTPPVNPLFFSKDVSGGGVE